MAELAAQGNSSLVSAVYGGSSSSEGKAGGIGTPACFGVLLLLMGRLMELAHQPLVIGVLLLLMHIKYSLLLFLVN